MRAVGGDVDTYCDICDAYPNSPGDGVRLCPSCAMWEDFHGGDLGELEC